MTSEPIWKLSLAEVARRVRARELSAQDATRAALERVGAVEERVHAFIHLDADAALRDARAVDGRLAKGEDVGPLAGVPIALKDVLAATGTHTTCGSKILEPFVSPYDATCVARLRSAGAVSLGKLNMDEFAMGSTTEHSAYGPTRNPWSLEHVPGGSSGGSAAAVAAGECFASLGSDTGGSIRQPASFCGVVGIKPTYGRVSRFGLVAFASSLDQIGPLARTVEDTALVLEVIAGHDSRDSTSLDVPVGRWSQDVSKGVRGLKLGIPKEAFGAGLDPEVDRAVRASIDRLAADGAEIIDVELPHTPYAVATYYVLAPAEASSNLARYDGVRYGLRAGEDGSLVDMYRKTRSAGFGDEVKRRILIGTYVLSAGYYDAYYRRAQQVRTLVRRDYARAFERCDALVMPVAPEPPFKLGEASGDPLRLYLSDVLTIGVNLAGLPGMSVPCGASAGGLPIGLQVVGPPLREDTLFRVAGACEDRSGWRNRVAPLDGAAGGAA